VILKYNLFYFVNRLILPGLCVFFLVTCSKDEKAKTYIVSTETVEVDSLSKIVLLKDTLVRPILYTHVGGLNKQPVASSKALFVSALLPSILVAKYEVNRKRERIELLIKKLRWDKRDSTFFMEMKTRYKAKDAPDLLNRMISIPNSIILAQAAVESGWGQSRFFLEANNVFGVWSYNRHEPRMRARMNRAVHLKVYGDISQSITDYLEVIGSARSYRGLRKARLSTDNPFLLIPHLKYYSISRERYTRVLKKMIVRNDFTRYDRFQIDPAYIVAEE
jgi:Bax protein